MKKKEKLYSPYHISIFFIEYLEKIDQFNIHFIHVSLSYLLPNYTTSL